DNICEDCWRRAIYAFGTAEILRKRTVKFKKGIQMLSFTALVFPVLIGGIVLGFGTQARALSILIPLAVVAGILQLVLSAWALGFNWSEKLDYAQESAADNYQISERFRELGSKALAPPEDLQVQFAEAKGRDDARRLADSKKGVTDQELRYGHRAAFRQFGRKCEGCEKVPHSMKSTDCEICGRF